MRGLVAAGLGVALLPSGPRTAGTIDLTVADLPVLAETIFDLNRLGDVMGKLLGLLMSAQQAVADLLGLRLTVV